MSNPTLYKSITLIYTFSKFQLLWCEWGPESVQIRHKDSPYDNCYWVASEEWVSLHRMEGEHLLAFTNSFKETV